VVFSKFNLHVVFSVLTSLLACRKTKIQVGKQKEFTLLFFILYSLLPVFGVPLETIAIRQHKPPKVPSVLIKLTEYIEQHCIAFLLSLSTDEM